MWWSKRKVIGTEELAAVLFEDLSLWAEREVERLIFKQVRGHEKK